MAELTREQIAGYAKGAGFTGKDLPIAVAVALAESGGETTSHNATPPDNSYGLWQINMLGSMGPDRRRALNIPNNEALYDPATNARAARMVWKTQGWGGWTTFTRGTYKKFLQPGDADAPAAATPEAPAGGDTSINPLNGISDSVNAFGRTIVKATENVAAVALAIALLVLGVVVLAREPLAKVLKKVKP